MGSEKHLLVNDDIFELINKKYAELILKGFKINMCDITNIILKNKIEDAELLLKEHKKE